MGAVTESNKKTRWEKKTEQVWYTIALFWNFAISIAVLWWRKRIKYELLLNHMHQRKHYREVKKTQNNNNLFWKIMSSS